MEQIAFFHFPKAGGSFLGHYIRAYLQPHVLGLGHSKITDVQDRLQNIFKISFIRNPFDWYVSRYFYFARNVHRTEAGISLLCDSGLYGDAFLERFPTFKSHLLWGMSEVKNFSFSCRYKEMFHDASGRMALDFIGKLEHMSTDLRVILKLAGVKCPDISLDDFFEMHHMNENMMNRSLHNPFQEYYDQEAAALVRKVDGELIDIYKYTFYPIR